MRIAQINLPVFDNDGADLDAVHQRLQRSICEKFGGFTVTAGQGAWVDDGKLYFEDVKVYQIAYEPDHVSRSYIRAMAQIAGQDGKQIAVFIVIDGESEIIEIV